MLLSGGAGVDSADHAGETPLHSAAYSGSVGVAGLLLSGGARVDAADGVGETPLHRAAYSGSVRVAELLLARGASAESVAAEAETVVLEMFVSWFRNGDRTRLAFKATTAELAVNNFQQDAEINIPRLGRFTAPMTSAMESLRSLLQRYYEMVVDSGLFRLVPHAPIVHLNGRRVHPDHAYFDNVTGVFRQAMENGEWTCVDCAEYTRDGHSILRTAIERGRGERRRMFSTRALDCRFAGGERLECIDPDFGIFEIGWHD